MNGNRHLRRLQQRVRQNEEPVGRRIWLPPHPLSPLCILRRRLSMCIIDVGAQGALK
jgi:hypothetical protein